MSSGSNQTSSFTGPPEWLQSNARGYLDRAAEVSGQEYQPYTGQRIADLSPTTRRGVQGLHDLAGNNPLGDAASDEVLRTLGGGYENPYAQMRTGGVQSSRNSYAGENPYFQQQMQKGAEKITDNYKKGTASDTARMFAMSGAFGGSAHQNAVKDNEEALGETLGNYTNSMLSGQYDRSAGLEEGYLGRDFAGQQFNAGLSENAINRGSGAYEQERNRQTGAVGQGMGLNDMYGRNYLNAIQGGDVERNQMQRLLDSQYGDFNEWRDYPNRQLDVYGNALTRAMGGAGSQTTATGPGPDRVSQGMGALALGQMLSRGSANGGSK